MMLVQTNKASRIILLDRRGYVELHDYIDNKRLSIMSPFRDLVKEMQSLVNVENAKRIIQLGGLPNEMRDGWSRMIEKFVDNDIKPSYTNAIEAASEKMAARIERARKQGFILPLTAVANWVNEEGGKLLTNLTAAQMANAHAVIQNQVVWNVTSPYQLAQIMKPAVGLTEREAIACSRLYSGVIEEGVGQRAATAQLEKYANYLHRARADRIARTEISDAYNFGQWDSVKQARDEGWLPGEPEKEWIAGGGNPCDICLDNEGEGPIPINQVFSSGDDTPTAHPSCACSLGYSVRR